MPTFDMNHDQVMINRIKLDVKEWMETHGQIMMGEQIQEDLITHAAISTVPTKEVDALCQIVIDNFNKHLVVSGQGYFNEIYMAELDGRREAEEKGLNKD